jgi:hypothetical protein
MNGKTGSHRALRARAGSRRGRRGRPVLQEQVLGAADGERRNCLGVRGVLSEVPEALMSGAATVLAFQRKQQAADALPSALTQSGHWRAQQRTVKQTSAYFELRSLSSSGSRTMPS